MFPHKQTVSVGCPPALIKLCKFLFYSSLFRILFIILAATEFETVAQLREALGRSLNNVYHLKRDTEAGQQQATQGVYAFGKSLAHLISLSPPKKNLVLTTL